MRKIIYTRPDGGVSTVTPIRSIEDSEMTDAEIEQRAWNRLPSDAVTPEWVDRQTIEAAQ